MNEDVQNSVCKIRVNDKCIGTGFLIAPNLLITAHHVVMFYMLKPDNDLSVEFVTSRTIVRKVIDIQFDSKYDIAVLTIDEPLLDLVPVSFVDFELELTELDEVQFETCGFPALAVDMLTFKCKIDSFRPNKVASVYLRFHGIDGASANLQGLSGAPLLRNNEVYGIIRSHGVLELGKHATAVRTKDIVSFLRGLDIEIEVVTYDNYKMLDKKSYLENILNKLLELSSEKEYIYPQVRKSIVKDSKFIIDWLRKNDPAQFENLISSIKLPLEEEFILDISTELHAEELAEIISHLVIFKLAYPKMNLQYTKAKPISLAPNRSISYVYSFKKRGYLVSVLCLMKYLYRNRELDFEDINTIIIGNTTADRGLCLSYCKEPYEGAKLNLDNIVLEITNPFEDYGERTVITRISQNLQSIRFHCENCLRSDNADMPEITNHIIKIVGG